MKKTLLLGCVLMMPLLAADRLVYVGTYTGSGSPSQGIYSFRFDGKTGKMSAPQLAAESTSPSFLAVSEDGKFVYAANEAGEGEVSAFAVEPGGKLRFLNKVASRGKSPCHLNIDPSGRWLAVANYSSGTAAVFPLGKDGKVGEAVTVVQHEGSSVNKQRQAGPHAHSVNFTADGKHLFVADLGLDQVKIYAFDAAKGSLRETAVLEVPAGGGPRHLSLGRDGLVYVLQEMGSAVSVYRWKGEAKLQPLTSASAIPAGFAGATTGAEVLLDKEGKLVFSSNRGHDSIAVFRTDPGQGNLELVRTVPVGGRTPRGFVLSPDGGWLLAASQNDDKIFVFRINAKTASLEPVGEPVSVGRPVCLRFAK
jgi:6-phosphogluconolactonase